MPAYNHACLHSKQSVNEARGRVVFENNSKSAFGLCRSNGEFQLTWCSILRLSKWAELSISRREVKLETEQTCERKGGVVVVMTTEEKQFLGVLIYFYFFN